MGNWILGMALALASFGAIAQESAETKRWYLLTETASDTKVYADSKTVRRSGDMVTVWLKYVYKVPKIRGGQSVYSTLDMVKFDCTQSTSQQLSSSNYGDPANGQVLQTHSTPGPVEPIVPGSVGEDLSDTICQIGK